jgi:hypothetical protein
MQYFGLGACSVDLSFKLLHKIVACGEICERTDHKPRVILFCYRNTPSKAARKSSGFGQFLNPAETTRTIDSLL